MEQVLDQDVALLGEAVDVYSGRSYRRHVVQTSSPSCSSRARICRSGRAPVLALRTGTWYRAQAMLVPPAEQAEAYLRAAAGRNPGPWVEHSRVAAGAARALGAGLPGVDPETAYVLGLLHDVGRGAGGAGVADVRHILDGFALLQRDGFAAPPGSASRTPSPSRTWTPSPLPGSALRRSGASCRTSCSGRSTTATTA